VEAKVWRSFEKVVQPFSRWFEDPIFYREESLMLGVLSHEAFAVLRIRSRICTTLGGWVS